MEVEVPCLSMYCLPMHCQVFLCSQVAKTAADCKMEMDVDEYVDSFRPGQCVILCTIFSCFVTRLGKAYASADAAHAACLLMGVLRERAQVGQRCLAARCPHCLTTQ